MSVSACADVSKIISISDLLITAEDITVFAQQQFPVTDIYGAGGGVCKF